MPRACIRICMPAPIAAAEVAVGAGGGFVVVKPNMLDMEKFEAAVVVAAG